MATQPQTTTLLQEFEAWAWTILVIPMMISLVLWAVRGFQNTQPGGPILRGLASGIGWLDDLCFEFLPAEFQRVATWLSELFVEEERTAIAEHFVLLLGSVVAVFVGVFVVNR